MWFKAMLPVSADVEKLWRLIGKYKRVNLGGENSMYTVYFTGNRADGLEVLAWILQIDDVHVELDARR